MSDQVDVEDALAHLQQHAPVPAAAAAAAPPAAALPPSILEANRIYCLLCKLFSASPAALLTHMQSPRHSFNCLYMLRQMPVLKCFVCNMLMLGPVEDHLISERHATNWYRFIVLKVPCDCNVYNYVRVAHGPNRPDTPVWRALRFDAVADQLYRQHLQMHRGYHFPLHDDYIELPLPDEMEEEDVDEEEVEELY